MLTQYITEMLCAIQYKWLNTVTNFLDVCPKLEVKIFLLLQKNIYITNCNNMPQSKLPCESHDAMTPTPPCYPCGDIVNNW